ncbi:MAG: 16S rRNA (guanine(966)-N(2))-methyltransferase RsmD [Desulfobulbus sp.]
MRITGGSARGRKLLVPAGDGIRPSCDRVREALFNILGDRILGARVLDLFAGTGAFGIEALSRGAQSALFVDRAREAGRLIEANLKACLSNPEAAFLLLDLTLPRQLRRVQAYLRKAGPFDLVFMDPPYRKELAQPVLEMVEEADILSPDALVVAEEHQRVSLPGRIGALQLTDQRRYGETGLWFYQQRPPDHP